MSHFDITEWADFVLGRTAAEKRDEMATHRNCGWPDCAQGRQLIESSCRWSAGTQVTLVGLFCCEDEQDRVDNRPVLLRTGGRVVARGLTNDFREFCLEYRHRIRLRLCINLEDFGTQIEVPFSQL
jgi:hypothetical protein